MKIGEAKIDGDALAKFAENLKAARNAAKLSQRGLAARCNTDYGDIGHIELAETAPSFFTILDLARGLGIPPKELWNEIE